MARTNGDIVLDWGDGGGGNLFNVFTEHDADLVDGALIIDMNAESPPSHTFSPTEPNEVRDVFIVLRKGVNTIPVAANDSDATISNMAKDIAVLENDLDAERSALTIVENSISNPSNGTAVISPDDTTKIRYTPGSDFVGSDEFSYQITDGTDTSLAATVSVAVGEVVFTRTHDSDVVPADGVLVTIEMNYSSAVAGEDLILTETFPRFDSALGFYTITTGDFNGLDIRSENNEHLPDTVTDSEGNALTTDPAPPSPEVNFTWNANALPPSPFSFQYRILGSTDDTVQKTISGVINHGTDTDGPEVVSTFGLSSGDQCHPADTDDDGKITIVEFVTFCGPVAAVFRRGVNGGEYCYDGTNLRAKGADDNCSTNEQLTHPADTDDDGKITIVEFVTFCGPVAAVFRRGVNGGEYCCNGAEVAPKTVDGCPDGFSEP